MSPEPVCHPEVKGRPNVHRKGCPAQPFKDCSWRVVNADGAGLQPAVGKRTAWRPVEGNMEPVTLFCFAWDVLHGMFCMGCFAWNGATGKAMNLIFISKGKTYPQTYIQNCQYFRRGMFAKEDSHTMSMRAWIDVLHFMASKVECCLAFGL
eukprot:364912-Chlamydomonas_euryale.AAC.22